MSSVSILAEAAGLQKTLADFPAEVEAAVKLAAQQRAVMAEASLPDLPPLAPEDEAWPPMQVAQAGTQPAGTQPAGTQYAGTQYD